VAANRASASLPGNAIPANSGKSDGLPAILDWQGAVKLEVRPAHGVVGGAGPIDQCPCDLGMLTA
jgi:hypothetical protein